LWFLNLGMQSFSHESEDACPVTAVHGGAYTSIVAFPPPTEFSSTVPRTTDLLNRRYMEVKSKTVVFEGRETYGVGLETFVPLCCNKSPTERLGGRWCGLR
jgi:hypothetical protein